MSNGYKPMQYALPLLQQLERNAANEARAKTSLLEILDDVRRVRLCVTDLTELVDRLARDKELGE